MAQKCLCLLVHHLCHSHEGSYIHQGHELHGGCEGLEGREICCHSRLADEGCKGTDVGDPVMFGIPEICTTCFSRKTHILYMNCSARVTV